MHTFAAIVAVSSGSTQVWLASRWNRLNSIQKMALLSLVTPTILFGIIFFS